MTKRISEEQALALLHDLYDVCLITNNFSISEILKKRGCKGMLKALIDAGFITSLASKGVWQWNLDYDATIEDARQLLAVHYADNDQQPASDSQQTEIAFKSDADNNMLADLIARKVVDGLSSRLPALLRNALHSDRR